MGRTAKPIDKKVGRPVRALVTEPVMDALEKIMVRDNLNLSEVLRLALIELLIMERLATDELIEDPTWDTIRNRGFV